MADRSALARATESTESPTPGYLYIDIAKSVSLSPAACNDTISYLIRRLQKNKNHNVKYKALKVIGKLAENAKGGMFKRDIICNGEAMSAIKGHLNYSGAPDPVRGDELYNRVRTAAKECLDMIYSDAPKSEGSFAGGGMGSGMASMGSAGYSGGGAAAAGGRGHGVSGGGGGGGHSMEGIGNPMYSDHRMEQSKNLGNMTVGAVAQTVGETIVGMIRDPLAKGVEKGVIPSRFAPPGSKELTDRTGGEWNMASNRGPNAIDPNRNYSRERDGTYYRAKDSSSNAFQWAQSGASAASKGGVGGSWAQPSISSQARASGHNDNALPPMGNVGAAASDGTYEKNLIQDLCPPGGLKAEPPPDKLASFANAVSSLDPDLICPAILDCLEDGQPWMMKAKALCVMETALKAASTGPSNPYADFFHACLSEFEPLTSHPRQAVKDPARRLLQALGIHTAPPLHQPTAPPQHQPSAPPPPPPLPVADLLDFGTDEPAPPPPPVPPPTEGNLFGGLEVRAEEPTQQPAAPPPAAAPPIPPPQPEQTPASDPTPNIFADMSIKENGSVEPSHEPDPPPAPSGFSFLNSNVPQHTTTSDPLIDTPTDNIPVPAPTTAYSELLDLSVTPAPPQIPIVTPKQTPKTFDPLLNLSQTPISPNKMLQQQQHQSMMMPQYNYNQNYMQMQMAMQMNAARMMNMPQPPNMANAPMPSPGQTQNNNIMIGAGNAARQSNISFINEESNKKKEQRLKTFDFVKDAMKNAK